MVLQVVNGCTNGCALVLSAEPKLRTIAIFFRKNVSFPTFLMIFCFSDCSEQIRSPLPEGNEAKPQRLDGTLTGAESQLQGICLNAHRRPGYCLPWPRIRDSLRAPRGWFYACLVLSKPPLWLGHVGAGRCSKGPLIFRCAFKSTKILTVITNARGWRRRGLT